MAHPAASWAAIQKRNNIVEGAPSTAGFKPRGFLPALIACHSINDFTSMLLPPLFPAIKASLALSYLQTGILQFSSTAVSAIVQVPAAYVADRSRKRRAFLVGGFLAYVVALFVLSRAGGYGTVVLATILLGLGASTYHPQSTSMIAFAYPKNRGRASGLHGIGNGIGFAASAAVGGATVSAVGWHVAAAVLSLPAAIGAVIARIALPEPDVTGHAGLFQGISKRLCLLTFVAGLTLAASQGFTAFLPTYYVSRGSSFVTAGLLAAVMQVPAVIAQPLGGALSDRIGRRNLLVVSPVGVAVSLVLFEMFSQMPPLQLLCSAGVGFWSSLSPPVLMVYASELAVGRRTGTAIALVWGAGIMLSSLAPPATGAIIDRGGFSASHVALAASAIAAALLALTLPTRTGQQDFTPAT